MADDTLTKGQRRTMTQFNPSGDAAIAYIKQKSADLIDLVEAIEDGGDPEIRRWKAEAQTQFEYGSMMGVKARAAEMQA